jgi:hypothetical protein
MPSASSTSYRRAVVLMHERERACDKYAGCFEVYYFNIPTAAAAERRRGDAVAHLRRRRPGGRFYDYLLSSPMIS